MCGVAIRSLRLRDNYAKPLNFIYAASGRGVLVSSDIPQYIYEHIQA